MKKTKALTVDDSRARAAFHVKKDIKLSRNLLSGTQCSLFHLHLSLKAFFDSQYSAYWAKHHAFEYYET